MIFRIILALAIVAIADTVNPLVERVGDTGFIQLEADSFSRLDARQQALAYWLTQASIAIDPIIYDQLSQYGIREKRLLEGIVAIEAPAGIRSFALLFWANRGNHNETTAQKFLPAFTFEELKIAAHTAFAHGAMRTNDAWLSPFRAQADLDNELVELKPSLFDPEFEPMITAKSPQGG